DAGAAIQFGSSGFTLVGSSLSGAGTVALIGGTLMVSNNVSSTVSSFVHSGGTLTGSGNLTHDGAYLWRGGVESGCGTNFLNGDLKINGFVTLTARTICSAASDIFTNGNLSGGGGAVFKNLPGGTVSLDDDFSLVGIGASLDNRGAFSKAG